MKPSDFSPSSPGKLVPIEFTEYPHGPQGKPRTVRTWAFIPDDLPPALDWKSVRDRHFDLYAETIAELGRLDGLHRRIGKAARLLRTLWMREAKLSCEIEHIDTTAEELVLAGAGRRLGVRESGRESWNYVQALEYGAASELPWSNRLIREIHRLLMKDVRGTDRQPGEFRTCGVFIGDPLRGAENARFVPMPPGEQLQRAMEQLEKFVNQRPPEIPPLFAIALAHYQFETIHPFRDGNGRIGRVLISLSLVKEGLLKHPVVYMSAYIARHKEEYVDLMLRISQHGGDYWSEWIGFILRAICTQARDAIWRSEHLISLREEYQELLKQDGAPARLFEMVDRLFAMPAINIKEACTLTNVSKPTAIKDIRRLERLGILTEYTGKERDRDWVARKIIDVIEQEQPIP